MSKIVINVIISRVSISFNENYVTRHDILLMDTIYHGNAMREIPSNELRTIVHMFFEVIGFSTN